eukprot:Rhum_TRINITY_DN14618_c32_g1::Rhum_TRINITY_DN14618_c32_g1_i1::g.106137::m.106137
MRSSSCIICALVLVEIVSQLFLVEVNRRVAEEHVWVDAATGQAAAPQAERRGFRGKVHKLAEMWEFALGGGSGSGDGSNETATATTLLPLYRRFANVFYNEATRDDVVPSPARCPVSGDTRGGGGSGNGAEPPAGHAAAATPATLTARQVSEREARLRRRYVVFVVDTTEVALDVERRSSGGGGEDGLVDRAFGLGLRLPPNALLLRRESEEKEGRADSNDPYQPVGPDSPSHVGSRVFYPKALRIGEWLRVEREADLLAVAEGLAPWEAVARPAYDLGVHALRRGFNADYISPEGWVYGWVPGNGGGSGTAQEGLLTRARHRTANLSPQTFTVRARYEGDGRLSDVSVQPGERRGLYSFFYAHPAAVPAHPLSGWTRMADPLGVNFACAAAAVATLLLYHAPALVRFASGKRYRRVRYRSGDGGVAVVRAEEASFAAAAASAAATCCGVAALHAAGALLLDCLLHGPASPAAALLSFLLPADGGGVAAAYAAAAAAAAAVVPAGLRVAAARLPQAGGAWLAAVRAAPQCFLLSTAVCAVATIYLCDRLFRDRRATPRARVVKLAKGHTAKLSPRKRYPHSDDVQGTAAKAADQKYGSGVA